MTSNGEPWWEGMSDNAPTDMLDWQGRAWAPSNGPAAQRIRATRCRQLRRPRFLRAGKIRPACPSPRSFLADAARASLRLVYEAMNWQHGVYVAATMASETTAAITGAVGVTRRDPMAMLPFCGYNMGDYFGTGSKWAEDSASAENFSRELVPQGRRREISVARAMAKMRAS
jgi:phosphoenolpyruvate carboxykinase (GTP)